jgi:hypothetical protein
MNSQIIYTATRTKIYVYTLKGMVLLTKLDAEYHMGRIELSSNSLSHPYLLYSNSFNEGNLIVYDTNKLEELPIIRCHKSTILKVSLNF